VDLLLKTGFPILGLTANVEEEVVKVRARELAYEPMIRKITGLKITSD
jgi:hypothetical protein